MNVLSLFDGISCGQVALNRAGILIDNYYASEVKKIAIETTQRNYPNTIQLGDVCKISYRDGVLYTENGNYETTIDILIGGSPCQNFSFANSYQAQEDYGLNGEKSKLFYEYLRLKEEIKPKYFLLENVVMKKESEKQLSEYLGVDSICINSNLLSYQNRNRLYWTNIPNVTTPKDKNINFQDYKDINVERLEEAKVNRTPSRELMWDGKCANVTYAKKVKCLTRKQDRWNNSGLIEYKDFCRFLTRRELELAQTLPAGFCDNLTFNQVQDVTGDGWTVDVIAHIFKGLK